MTDYPPSSDYRRIYMQTPAPARRCEVRSSDGQCPNEAEYLLFWGDDEGVVCRQCLGGWITRLVLTRDRVAVSRLNAPTKVTF